MTKHHRTYNTQREVSSINGVGNWTATGERMILDCFLSPYTKINSKGIQLLNTRPEAIKYIDENTGSKPLDLVFLWIQLQRHGEKSKNKEIGLYQTKNLLSRKGNHQQKEKASYQTEKGICKLIIQ